MHAAHRVSIVITTDNDTSSRNPLRNRVQVIRVGEGREGSVSQEKTVDIAARLCWWCDLVTADDIATRIDAASHCTACPRDIDCRKDTIAEQKTMRFLVGIGV